MSLIGPGVPLNSTKPTLTTNYCNYWLTLADNAPLLMWASPRISIFLSFKKKSALLPSAWPACAHGNHHSLPKQITIRLVLRPQHWRFWRLWILSPSRVSGVEMDKTYGKADEASVSSRVHHISKVIYTSSSSSPSFSTFLYVIDIIYIHHQQQPHHDHQ